MPYVSHRSAAARTFDCLYDPNYTVSSTRDALHASANAANNGAPMHIYSKYEVMFENAPKETRLIFRKQRSLPTPTTIKFADMDASSEATDATERLEGGTVLTNLPTNRKLQKVIASAGECKAKSSSSGLYLYRPYTTTDVNVINVRLSDSNAKVVPPASRLRAQSTETGNIVDYQQCDTKQPNRKRIISKTRGTQTLYRESSAQTLPYLPDVAGDKELLKDLEVFRLPALFTGDGPPGLHEVEILERARKRWAFEKALKANFKRQLKKARQTAKRPEHKHILEAFEWEQWIEREEHIQECQMLRLELLIRMFDKREREMHEESKARLTKRCADIEEKRQTALRKNEVEFGREMRRLEMRRRKVPRNWRKDNICDQLGQPSSEFYAPQMRYGVNPNRRHFAGGSKAFEMRMDNLEKQAISMGKLVCPYAKLKEWSKPKQQAQEYEQNFCSDDNLKKLYESMKHLRELQEKRRSTPKCLIQKSTVQKEVSSETVIEVQENEETSSETLDPLDMEKKRDPEKERRTRFEEIRREAEYKRQRLLFLLDEKRNEEVDSMIADYEGSTIGWLMRFLTEEMDRLQEQRKLHFITMMAQRERWRREAAEAGLRQKENNMRQIYEQLYQESTTANDNVAGEYLDHILRVEVADYADDTATQSVLELARIIDEDIKRWLHSIHDIQTPLNFDALRYLLKNLIFPNAEMLLQRYEAEQSVRYIIDDVLFPRVHCLLEPYDIGISVAEEAIDRTIDTDLYYFSSQSECSTDCDLCPSEASCDCTPEKREADALMRKLIRYVVPGRRWKTSDERIAYENASDILDAAFRGIMCKKQWESALRGKSVTEAPSHINLLNITPPGERENILDTDSSDGQLLHINILDIQKYSMYNSPELKEAQYLTYTDAWRPSEESDVLQFQSFKQEDEGTSHFGFRQASAMKRVFSTIDIMAVADDFLQLDTRGSHPNFSSSINSDEIITSVTRGTIKADEKPDNYIKHLVNQIVKMVVPAEEDDSDLSEYQVEEEFTQFEDIPTDIPTDRTSELFDNNAEGDVGYLLHNIFKGIPRSGDDMEEDFCEESSTERFEDEKRIEEEERFEEKESEMSIEDEDHFIEISESELELINDKERCKCASEKQREIFVRRMMAEGKVRIKYREIPLSESSVDMGSLNSFEYRSLESHALLTAPAKLHDRDMVENSELSENFEDDIPTENNEDERISNTQNNEDEQIFTIENNEDLLVEDNEIIESSSRPPEVITDVIMTERNEDEDETTHALNPNTDIPEETEPQIIDETSPSHALAENEPTLNPIETEQEQMIPTPDADITAPPEGTEAQQPMEIPPAIDADITAPPEGTETQQPMEIPSAVDAHITAPPEDTETQQAIEIPPAVDAAEEPHIEEQNIVDVADDMQPETE